MISAQKRNFCLANILFRQYHSTKQLVRVRFAPSPTGYLHLGGLRTALYNYLFAKANNGTFILRIEDTDQNRLVGNATKQLLTDLEWAGIIPDEGPEYGGNYGPYIQSERIDIYKKYMQELLDKGSAYRCFCSDRRLDIIRREAIRASEMPKYDNRCRNLTLDEISEKLANNQKYCVRFKLNSSEITFNDLIYNDITYDIAKHEGDPIIIKSDGFPTYHFANVVDDHKMKISHVFRGMEWQVSTIKHILLYKAFGWENPQYAHLPLILNADGSKLSKRQGDIKIESFRERGIFPQALLNFITQSGGGFDQTVCKKRNIDLNMNDLIKSFNIKRINAHSSRLNMDILKDCNRAELRKQLEDPEKCGELVGILTNLVGNKYPQHLKNLNLNKEYVISILNWACSRISSLHDLTDDKLSFLWIFPEIKNDINIDKDIFNDLINNLENIDNFDKINLQIMLKEFSKKEKLSYSKFMKILRNLLSGLNEGPGVAEMMEILGKRNTIAKLSRNNK